MKKILYVTTISNTLNGFLIPHIEMLVNMGYQVDIACNIVRPIDDTLKKLVTNIYEIKFERSPLNTNNLKAYKQIKEVLENGKYDIVHCHTPVASFLTRLACRKINNMRVIYTAHGFHFFKGAPLKNWLIYYPLEKLVARFTDGIITINEEDYKLAKKMKLRRENSIYKVNGVGIDLNKFKSQTEERKRELRKQYGYSETDFILICVAELNHNKHQDLLINVINILKNIIPNIKLLLVGEGNLMEQYKNQVKKLNLEDYIKFLGYRKDVPNLMAISDVAVSASRREGLPVNVMEAMATGLPLVVTDCRGNRDLVRNGRNGYVVGINDVDGFADAVEKLYKIEKLRQNFSEKNCELIKMYSIKNVKNELEKIYLSLLNDK